MTVLEVKIYLHMIGAEISAENGSVIRNWSKPIGIDWGIFGKVGSRETLMKNNRYKSIWIWPIFLIFKWGKLRVFKEVIQTNWGIFVKVGHVQSPSNHSVLQINSLSPMKLPDENIPEFAHKPICPNQNKTNWDILVPYREWIFHISIHSYLWANSAS